MKIEPPPSVAQLIRYLKPEKILHFGETMPFIICNNFISDKNIWQIKKKHTYFFRTNYRILFLYRKKLYLSHMRGLNSPIILGILLKLQDIFEFGARYRPRWNLPTTDSLLQTRKDLVPVIWDDWTRPDQWCEYNFFR